MPGVLVLTAKLRQGSDPYPRLEAVQELLDAVSPVRLPFSFNQTDLLAPTAQNIISPIKGRVIGLVTIVQVTITTGGTIIAKVGTTTVAGLTATIANSATVGTINAATAPTNDGTEQVARNQRIQVTPASFASAGAVTGYVELEAL